MKQPSAAASTSITRDASGALPGTTRAIVTVSLLSLLTMTPVTMLVPPLKELIAVRYGASAFWTHSFMSVNMIGALAAAPLLGFLSDRSGLRRQVIALSLGVDAILLSAMTFAPNVASLLVLRFVEGAAHILAISTLMAVAAGWAGTTHRGRIMGAVGAAMMFGTACGTRLGGLAWHAAPGWTFHIAGMIAAAVAFLSLLFVRERAEDAPHRTRIRDVVSLLLDHRPLTVPYAFAFIDRLCVGVIITTFVLFLGDVRGLSPDARSRLLVMFLVPFAICVYPAGRLVDRIGRIAPICLGSAAFGVIMACYAAVSAGSLSAVMLLSGLVSALMFAPNLALCTDLAPPEKRGAVFTGFNLAGSLGFLVGPLLAGATYTILSARADAASAYSGTFIVAGATEILCAAVTLPWLLRLKRRGLTR